MRHTLGKWVFGLAAHVVGPTQFGKSWCAWLPVAFIVKASAD